MDESALYGIGTFVVAKTLLHCLSTYEDFVDGGATVIDRIFWIFFLSTGIIGRITPNCELGWEVGGKGRTGDDVGDLEPIQVHT